MEQRTYARIVAAVLSRPWVIRQEFLPVIADIVAMRIAGERLSNEEIAERIGDNAAQRQPVATGGVAVLPLYGVLVPRAGMFAEMSGGTSMARFRAQFREAMASPMVSSIVIDVDSPGGLVDLVPETAEEIRAARGTKPIVAIANTEAASAAYWIASQADELVASPSSVVGSIGVFTMHDDISRALEGVGVTKSLISAGKYKVEGNPFEPLGDEARTAIQARVDEFYRQFVDAVARGRGVKSTKVRGGYGEGRALHATHALAEGMVDRIDTFEGVLRRLGVRTPGLRASTTTTDSANAPAADVEPVSGGMSTVVTVQGKSLEPTAAAEALAILLAGPIPPHNTAVVDRPWDGPGNEAKLDNDAGAGVFRRMYAWENPDGDPDTKAGYSMPHHEVDDGEPGPANAAGCRAVLQSLPKSNIPEADHAGVERHAQNHLDALEDDEDQEARARARARRDRMLRLRRPA